VDIAVALFFMTAMIAAAFSSVQPTSWEGLGKFATFLAAYSTFRFLPEKFQQGWVPVCLVALAGMEALVGFYQYLNHIQPLATWEDQSVNPELRLTRIFGTLKPSNPNLLAGFLIPPLAVSGYLTLRALVQAHWRQAIVPWLLCVGILAALALTGSRGGFLAMGTMGLSSFLLLGHLIWRDPHWPHRVVWKKLWFGKILAALLLVGGILAISPAIQHRVASIFAMRDDSSNAFRLNVYHSAWQMFQDNWLLGIGPGNGTFKLVYGL
jgi:putative inorganic carbon (HCO3(-)) transporter